LENGRPATEDWHPKCSKKITSFRRFANNVKADYNDLFSEKVNPGFLGGKWGVNAPVWGILQSAPFDMLRTSSAAAVANHRR